MHNTKMCGKTCAENLSHETRVLGQQDKVVAGAAVSVPKMELSLLYGGAPKLGAPGFSQAPPVLGGVPKVAKLKVGSFRSVDGLLGLVEQFV